MPSAIEELERHQAPAREPGSASGAAGPVEDSVSAAHTVLDALVSDLRLDFACARLKDARTSSLIDLIRLPGGRSVGEEQQDACRAFSRCLDAEGHKWPFVIANPLGLGHVSIGVAALGPNEKQGLVIAGSGRVKFPSRAERQVLVTAANALATRLEAAFGMHREPQATSPAARAVAQQPEAFTAANEAAVPDATESDTGAAAAPPTPTAAVPDRQALTSWCPPAPSDLYEANAALERIVRDTARPNEVVSRIQTFVARNEAPRIRVRLTEVIADVLRIVQDAAQAQAVSFRIDSPAGIPPVVGDPIQLQQVVVNLVMNAVEAMLEVNARRRVLAISVRKHGTNAVLVRIRDAGKGLEPQQRQRIFDPFYTTKPDGMGMGLTISRTIVEAHCGRLWASANDDFGETFQFTLPIAERAAVVTDPLGLTGSP